MRFENENGSIIELIEVDKEKNYVLYKVNGIFKDTTIEGFNNIIKLNNYKMINYKIGMEV